VDLCEDVVEELAVRRRGPGGFGFGLPFFLRLLSICHVYFSGNLHEGGMESEQRRYVSTNGIRKKEKDKEKRNSLYWPSRTSSCKFSLK
jgi:hypothetical protein